MSYYADEQSYEEVIAGLRNFKARIQEECAIMQRAGEDCIDNTDNEPAVLSNCSKLASCLQGVNMNLELIDTVIRELQAQIERIREASRRASQD